MSISATADQSARPAVEAADARAAPPVWVSTLLGIRTPLAAGHGGTVRTSRYMLAHSRVANAAAMDGPALEHATARAYKTLAVTIREATPWHPVRIWNFVPRILADGGEGMDRYMRFNAGRYRAFAEWFGGAQGFDRVLPAASAVGHGGDDLLIHLLAAREPGTAVANPRQVSPCQYSRRFGPLPPCFARATRLMTPDRRELLLVGGTASIRGEESVHAGDLQLQLAETFDNLAALVEAAFGRVERPLERYRALRVYFVRTTDLPVIKAAVAAVMPRLRAVEWFPAELCRGELLVEIEGIAESA